MALSSACHEIKERIKLLGPLPKTSRPLESRIPVHTDRDALRIAIIEDNAAAGEAIARFFRYHGCHAAVFYDGLFAFDVIKAGAFDVVVSDWSLPGMTGTEICKGLRSKPSKKPLLFILVSGFGDACTIERAVEAGVDGFFPKPADLEQMFISIKKWHSSLGKKS